MKDDEDEKVMKGTKNGKRTKGEDKFRLCPTEGPPPVMDQDQIHQGKRRRKDEEREEGRSLGLGLRDVGGGRGGKGSIGVRGFLVVDVVLSIVLGLRVLFPVGLLFRLLGLLGRLVLLAGCITGSENERKGKRG